MKVLVAGGSGPIGRAVLRVLEQQECQIRVLVRRPVAGPSEVRWDPQRGELDPMVVAWADAVVSLNGVSLMKLPWSASYRREIRDSRVAATSLIARIIAQVRSRPRAWVSGSAVGVYGNRPGEVLTEESGRGSGFLADVVDDWEQAAAPATGVTRVVLARTSFVLGDEGVLPLLARLGRFGLLGRIGNGQQYWPWISLADEARAIVHLATDSDLSGPVNLVAPTLATADDVTGAISQILHRPHVVPAPAWLLRAGLADAADDLLLADQQVVPERLTEEGTFHFLDLDLNKLLTAGFGSGFGFRRFC